MKYILPLGFLVSSAFAQTSTTTLNPSNQSTSSKDIDSIYVIGSQDEAFLTPGSAQFISEKELKKFDYSDPNRQLQTVPGLYIQEEDGYGLRPSVGLRGATPHRSKKITLMEDGVLIAPAPYAAPAAYFFPNMMKTSTIEVFKGASSVKYGPNSIGGAINFVTNPIPNKTKSEIGISYGEIEKYEFSTGGREGRFGYLLEFNRGESDGFKTLPDGGDTGFEKNDFMVKTDFKIGPMKQKVALKASYSEETSHETYLGLTNEDFQKDSFSRYAASANDLMEWKHQQYQLRHSISPSSNSKVETTLYYHEFQRAWNKLSGFGNGIHISNYLSPNSEFYDPHFLRVLKGKADSFELDGGDQIVYGNNRRRYYSTGAQVASTFYLNQSDSIFHTLNIGLKAHKDQIKRFHTKDTLNMTGGELVATSSIGVAGTQNKDTADAISLSVEDEVDFSNGWILSAGSRFEDVRMKRQSLLESAPIIESRYQNIAPGMGLQYAPNNELVFLTGVNRGISIVAPGQSESIQPEESINYEAGVKYNGALRGEFIGFFNDYKNIKGFCSFSTGCDEADLDTEFNGGQANIYGFEAQLSGEYAAKKVSFPVNISYTKTIAEFASQAESKNNEWGVGTIRKGDPLPYIPEDKISITFGATYKKFSNFFTYNWQSFTYDQVVQEGRRIIDSYDVMDWSGKYSFTKDSNAFLKVDNIFAKEYITSLRPFGARPGKPQSLSVGFKHVF